MATIVGANTALTVRLIEQRLGRAMTDEDFEVLTLASAHNAQQDVRDRLRRRPARRVPDFTRARDVLRRLRRFPVPDAVLAAAADRRTQHDVAGSVAYRADPAPLHAGDRDVQHVRPAGDVGAAGLEQGRVAARHDVLGQVRRRGDFCSGWRANWSRRGPGRADCRRSARKRDKTQPSFRASEAEPGRPSGGSTRFCDGVLIRRLNRESKRSDRQCAGGDRQHSRSAGTPARAGESRVDRAKARWSRRGPIARERLRRSRPMAIPGRSRPDGGDPFQVDGPPRTMATIMSTRPSARIPRRSSAARCRGMPRSRLVDDRESDARRRFEQLKSEMTGAQAAARTGGRDGGERADAIGRITARRCRIDRRVPGMRDAQLILWRSH